LHSMGCGASVQSGGGGGGSGGAVLNLSGNTVIPTGAFNKSGIVEVAISKCRLAEIPVAVFELAGLLTLDIAENDISKISPLIANLSSLQVVSAPPMRQAVAECRPVSRDSRLGCT
jgi:hypothetical protein